MRQIYDLLESQLKKNRLCHAYLVYGSVEIEVLTQTLAISESDLFRLNETPIKIGHIRQFIHWIMLKPHSSERKLALICNIESMTLDAANALLKVLEEPPAHSVIVLQSAKNKDILPTICSRCQIVNHLNEGEDDAVPEDYLSPDEISKLSVKAKFDYANALAQADNLSKYLDHWEEFYRDRLLTGIDSREVIRLIMKTKGLLSTNSSVKLLMEYLFLNFRLSD